MDKTHNISLGGFAFNIDDAAYSVLKKYLNDVRFSLKNSTGVDEIISDVEYRMAELLRERMMSREVVNQYDVDYLIGIMGKPEDFYTDEFLDEEDLAGAKSKRTYTNYSSTARKKLFRDPDDKMIGGVCSGLAHYIGIDSTWMRIIVIVMPFLDVIFLGISTSFVFLAYIILWLVVPEAKTTSDKLQMRGEPVNFDSIKDFFGNSPEHVRNNLKDFGDDARRVANSSGSVIGNLIRILFKIIGIFFLIILVFIAFVLLASFVASIFGLGIAGFGLGVTGLSLSEYLPYIFEGGWEQWVAYISLGLVMVIPAIGLILLVLRLISKRYRIPRIVGFSLPFLWFIGLMGLVAVTVTTLRSFQRTSNDVATANITTTANTLVIQQDQEHENFGDLEDFFSIRDGYLAIPHDDDILVKKSETGTNYLEFKYSAKGKSSSDAAKNLKGLDYKYEIKDSLVRLDDILYLKDGNKWRAQQMLPTLYLKEGTNVVFRNMDVESYSNGNREWHDTDSEKMFTFEGENFKCINCTEEVEITEEIIDSDSIKVSHEGVIKLTDGKDSITIKTNQDGTNNISIYSEGDSISN